MIDSAATIAQDTIDEYPQQDFRIALPCPVPRELPAPRRRPFYLGIYRICRALIRRRQEASATRDVRQSAEAAVMGAKMECTKLSRQHSEEKQRHDRKVAELESTIDDLHEKVLHREEQIRILRELDIEKLNRQIGVLEAENEYLAACHERELNLKRAEIAVSNMVITDGANREHQMERGMR